LETDKQSSFHLQLAQQIRNELENPAAAFVARQAQHRKVYQGGIEKQFKTKQAQEGHVNKAREKYEQDCLRINAYTAQSTLVQGKDLERISLKLERAQQTVHSNEREFSNFARALQDTVSKWEQEWKQFCDSCQDLEEERMEFTKDNVWAYANAVSIVCVSDDEVGPRCLKFPTSVDHMIISQSCERLRLALESFEPEKDQENFVRDYGTGNAMPDPPLFVNYSSAEGVPLTSSASKVTSRPAQFARASQRVNRLPSAPPQSEDEQQPFVNTAGVGAGNRTSGPPDPVPIRTSNLSRSSTRRNAPQTNGNSNANGANGFSPGSSPPATASRNTGNFASAPAAAQPPVNQTQHELVIGDNTYKVDLPGNQRDQSKNQFGNDNPRGSAAGPKVGDETDPMVQAMANLRTGSGAVGRNLTRKVTPDPSGQPGGGSSSMSPTKVLAPPTSVSPPGRNLDYRNSAEIVVGAHPTAQPPGSRSTSPAPPTATFMQPPPQAPAPVVDAVINSYGQSFPDERRSRSNSRRASFNANAPPPQQLAAAPSHGGGGVGHGSHLERPVSREGHAGIGANGRSRSPSLSHPPSRNVSPAPPGPPRGGSVNPPDQGPGQYRATTPIGIALDPHGNVAVDAMADAYRQQQQVVVQQQQQQVAQARQIQQQPQAPPPMQAPPSVPAQYQQQGPPQQQQQLPQQPQQQQLQALGHGGVNPRPPAQRQPSIGNSFGVPGAWQPGPAAPPPQQQQQQQYVPPPPVQQQPQVPQHSPAYVQAPHPYANAPPSQVYHAPQVTYGMQQSMQQQQQQQRQQQQQQQRGATASAGGGEYYAQQQGYAPQPLQQQQQQQLPPPQQYQQQHHNQHQLQQHMNMAAYGGGAGFRAVSPGPMNNNRTPSPQPMALTQPPLQQSLTEPPTQQYTEDGRGVLFYGASPFYIFPRGTKEWLAVRALYDYTATIPEEFDFQANDIIAVTATPEDGWWSGELLDDKRRVPGKFIFPSNFVSLF
jgi:hypothetical protein